MGRSLAALAESGIAGGALTVGDKAPDFTSPNATGGEVTLSELLVDGPAVLSSYRGAWCRIATSKCGRCKRLLMCFVVPAGPL